jgi:putative ABC transport system permease protein
LTFLDFLLRNLARRRGRSVFTVLGVALAVASFSLLYGLAAGMREAARVSLDERDVHLVVTKRGTVEFFSGVLPQSFVEDIRRVPGVREATAELATLAPLGDSNQALVVGWPPDSFEWRSVRLSEGVLPRPGEGEAIIGDMLAEAAGKKIGDAIELNFQSYRIVGITSYGATLNRGMVALPLEDLQTLMSREGMATLFEARLANPGDPAVVEATRRAIIALRNDVMVTTSEDLFRENRAMRMLDRMSTALAILSLAIACLSILNTMAMAVEERAREIGILSAIGWPRRRILGMIIGEGLLLSVVGSLLGGALGYLLSDRLSEFVLPGAGISAAARLDIALAAGAIALVIGGVGAFYPGLLAARLDPAAALRRL